MTFASYVESFPPLIIRYPAISFNAAFPSDVCSHLSQFTFIREEIELNIALLLGAAYDGIDIEELFVTDASMRYIKSITIQTESYPWDL